MSDIVEKYRDLERRGFVLEPDQEVVLLRHDVERLRAQNAELVKALNAENQTLRLHLGEMTSQEMRTLRAGFLWVLSRAVITKAGGGSSE